MENYRSAMIYYHHSVDDDPKDSNFPLHVHNDYELYCVVSGNVGYTVEGRVYALRPGSLMIMRSAEIHKLIVYGNGRYERYAIHFSPELLEKYGFDSSILDAFTDRKLGEHNLYEASSFSGVSPLGVFRQIEAVENGRATDAVFAAYIAALLYSVNTVFYAKEESLEKKEDSFEKQLITYINEHILDELTLGGISEEMHISPSQLNRIFNRLTGTSVYNYILSKRLVYARGMIERGEENAASASQACGFKDYSSFFRLYKKRFGVAPTYQKKQKG